MAETSITVRLIDETRAGFSTLNSNLDRLDSNVRGIQTQMTGLGNTVNGLVKDIVGLASALAGAFVVKELVTTAAQFETLRASVGAVTKDVKVGNAVFEELKSLAVDTVFGVEDLTKAYIKMTAAGVAPSTQQLKLFNDVASVSSDQLGTLQALADLFARTVGGGLGLEDLNRLADRGIPVYKILGDTMGVTRDQLSKLGSTAQGAKLILDALQDGLQKDFGGAADKQVGTLNQSISQLKDAAKNAADAIGQAGLNKALSDLARDITNFIKENPKAVESIGKGLADAVKTAADAFKFLRDNIDTVVTALGIFVGAVVIQRIAALTVALTEAAAAGTLLSTALNRIPLAAIATLLGVLGLEYYKSKQATDANTQSTNENADANAQNKKTIDELAAEQARQTQITKEQIYANLSLSDKVRVLSGETQLLQTATGKYADEARKLLQGTGDLRSELGKYLDELDRSISLQDQDSVAKKLSTETTKALEAAMKSAKEAQVPLTDAVKQYIVASVQQKITTAETAAAMKKAEEDLFIAQGKIQDATSQYIYEQTRLRLEQNKRTIQNEEIFNKEMETLRLNFIASDLQMQRDAQRNTLDDLGKFQADATEAVRRYSLGIYKNEQELNNQLLALRQNFEAKYKGIIDQARTTGLTDAQRYLDQLFTLEDEFQKGAITSLTKYEEIKNAITRVAQQTRIDEAKAYRISEGGAEAAYAANIQKLNEDLAAGLIKTDEDKNTLLRKYNKEYRDAISSEYSTLYNDLNNQIMKFTGQTQEQFSRTKEIIKLVFGVDLQDLIKQFFASAIRWVIGFREGTQGEMNLVPSIIKSAFGDSSTNTISGWISGAVNLFKSFSSSVGDIFSGIGSFISNIFSSGGGLLGTISSFVGSALGILKGFGSSAASAISSTVSTVGSALGVTTAATGATTAATLTAAESGIALGGMGVGGGAAAAATGAGVLETIGAAASGVASTVGGIIAAAAPVALAVAGVYAIYKGIKSLFGGSSKNKGPSEADVYRDKVAQIQDALRNNTISVGPGKRADGSYDYLTRQAYNGRTGERYNQPRDFNESLFYTNTYPQRNEQGTPIGPNPAGGEWAKLVFYGLQQGDAMKAYLLQTEDTTYGAKGLAYAAGNLISMPTVFGTNSGMAIGGELGTEAIMPLGRDSQGRLGVSAIGGAGNININFTINAVDSRGIDQLLVEKRSLITNIVRTAVADRGGRI